jgi:predicted secreted hydrolase
MNRRLTLAGLLVVGLLLALLLYPASRPDGTPGTATELGLNDVLGSSTPDDFARVLGPHRFVFPRDHGPHPEYRSEWWYVTGNLRTDRGKRFGFQLTFFRFALSAEAELSRSAWATNQAWMAHLAVTDVSGQHFYSFERLSRGVLGMAGARAKPFHVWLEDWELGAVADTTFPIRLVAAEDGVSLTLEAQTGKPLVLQGDQGLSQKGDEPGNASYYYSKTRLPVSGQIETPHSGQLAVTGLAWLDREWGTSALGHEQVGWDWFALQLGDNVELMFYRLRRRDGSADPHSAGSLVRADGTVARLAHDDVRIEVMDRWRSEHTNAIYPSGWRLSVPSASLDLRLRPELRDQEMDHSVRYWEGAVSVEGTRAGEPIRGHGYVELTGYDAGQ